MGNFARETGKGKERRDETATGLIEIDAMKIFGFLLGSRSPMRERERERKRERERERKLQK